MHRLRVLLVDAFTDEPLAGNAAGVVPDADGLSADEMQAVARELAVSETAFLRASADADRRVRYFSPTVEVDLCGHATIASYGHLLDAGGVDPGTHTLETNVGVIDVEVEGDGTVWMTQADPRIREVDVGYDRVADVLGIDAAALTAVDELPLAAASTGLPFLLVPVSFLEQLGNASPDMAAVEKLCRETDTEGLYAFTFDTLEADTTLHGRAFVPLAGIPEDPVTGTASGAAGAYLERFGALDPVPEEMVFEQGHFLDRPGRVHVRTGGRIRVGGRTATALEGRLTVPERDTDDIREA